MTNPRADRVRDVAKLATRTARLRRRQFLAEGPQAVREALRLDALRRADGGLPVVVEVYASEACLSRYHEIAHLAEATGRLRLADDDVLAAMADTVTPQGIVAVCAMLDVPLESVLSGQARLVAVMCRVQDPGNAGTILRAADSAGADAVVLTAGSVDIYNPKAVRSTAGSLFHVPVVLGVDVERFAAAAREAGLGVLAADGAGRLDLDELQDASAARRVGAAGGADEAYHLEDPTAWFFGNEAQGLSDTERELADHSVAVPLYGRAESLNVGTAATVCLYASARSQRRGAGPGTA